MEIVIVQPYGHQAGHYSVYTHRLCAALVREGHDVRVLSSHGFRDHWTDSLPLQHQAVALSNYVRRVSALLPGRWLRARFEALCVQRRGFELVHGHDERVLHILDFEPLTLWLLNRLYRGGRHVLTLAGADYTFRHYYKGNLLRGCYGALSRLCVAEITRTMPTVVHAERLAVIAEERRLLGAAPVAVIPWGMDPRVNGLGADEARRRLGLDDGPPVALMFGAMRTVKGLDDLIDAVALLGPNRIRVLVAGEAMLDFDPVQRAAERGCADDFLFHMRYIPDEEKDAFFRAADLAVLPYKGFFHGESGVLAHTSEYGLPVVASDTGELGKRVREQGLGLLCEPDNAASLAAALRRFVALQSEERRELRARVATYAASNTWARVAQRHVEVYQMAAAARLRRAAGMP